MGVRSLTAGELVSRQMPSARDDLERLVSFRSVADPRQAPREECDKAARCLVAAFSAVGLHTRIHRTRDGSGAVLGVTRAPPGAPTVLLCCHYDVRAAGPESTWRTPPFRLTGHANRWYGRGTADGKGDIVAFLTALRAVSEGDGYQVGVRLLAEGSAEQGTGDMQAFVPEHADLLEADAVIVCGAGSVETGVPTLTTALRGVVIVDVTVDTLAGGASSDVLAGPTPDALAALVRMLATLRDEQGNTTVRELDGRRRWTGACYSDDRFRHDANLLEGVDLLGDGTVADMLWARPALTILGIDCPPVVGATAEIQPRARARLELRIPPGVSVHEAEEGLATHLQATAPWHARVTVTPVTSREPFRASTHGPAYQAMSASMAEAYGAVPATAGLGGAISLCTVLHNTFPDAEIMILGVAEPACCVHAPNESVDPMEIERLALAEARFLETYPTLYR
jgi:acetylornithine deacetylase/succinyl-diaminopimelate desuccinylase-like protein